MSRKGKGKVIPMTLRQEEKDEIEELLRGESRQLKDCDCTPRYYLVSGRKTEISGPVCRRCLRGVSCHCRCGVEKGVAA